MQIEISRRILSCEKYTKILATILAGKCCSARPDAAFPTVSSRFNFSSSASSSGGTFNLVGVDGTLQLKVFAMYHSGKMIDVTNDFNFLDHGPD